MRGGRNDHRMTGIYQGDAVTKESTYLMIQFNSTSTKGAQTPGVLNNGQGHIWGEIYEVDDAGLTDLDKLEDNGRLYQREEILLDDGSKAWMYILIADKKPSALQDRVDYDQTENTYKWDPCEPAP